MELRKFYATSVDEAMTAIRAELGEDVVILDIRTIREAGEDDAPPVERVEVWVQCESAPAPAIPPQAPAPEPEPASVIRDPEPVVESAAAPEPSTDETDAFASIEAQLRDALALAPEEEAISTPPEPPILAADGDLAAQLAELREQLRSVHGEMDTLREGMGWMGVGSLGGGTALSQCIVEGLSSTLTYSGGIRCLGTQHVVALIGPTGVGKTTMVAKLAWHFAVTESLSVGVLAADTQRVGAVEQVARYCRHLDVPCETIYTPEDVPAALERLADCRLVLIDTPGAGQRHTAVLEDVQALLLTADPAEVHLVLSANVSSATVRDIFHHYAGLHPDQLILTKLDETPGVPDVLPLAVGSGMAVSYLSAGQRIDTDLHVAAPEKILRFLGRGQEVF